MPNKEVVVNDNSVEQDIVSLGISLKLEVDENDIVELQEGQSQEITAEELVELQHFARRGEAGGNRRRG